MFYNMGGKLKLLGKIQFWALSALSLCYAVAIVLLNTMPLMDALQTIPSIFLLWPNQLCESLGEALLRSLLVFVIGVVVAYISAVPVIAFGELVDDTAENKRVNKSLSDHLRSKTSTTAPINTASKQVSYQQPYPVSPYQTYQPVVMAAPVAPVAPAPAAEPAPVNEPAPAAEPAPEAASVAE